MKDILDKRTIDINFHPADFSATEEAASVARVDTAEFCKLAIHVITQRTLAGEWPPSLPAVEAHVL